MAEFPHMMNGAKAQMVDGNLKFTYIDSYGSVITETKDTLSPKEIKHKVVDRLHRFMSAGPGSRESELSRAERKWISAHPESILKKTWNSLDEHGQMEMSMMLSMDSHYGISSREWAKAHVKERSNIIGDNMTDLD